MPLFQLTRKLMESPGRKWRTRMKFFDEGAPSSGELRSLLPSEEASGEENVTHQTESTIMEGM